MNNFDIEYILTLNVLFVKDNIPTDILEYFETAECKQCYVCKLVVIFREVHRVLKNNGTAWINLGSSYAGNTTPGGGDPTIGIRNLGESGYRKKEIPPGFKPKDLVPIPWMVAMALQHDGWYLRSDIIWAKKNPMPESCTDRPTKAHEYIFLLSKNKKYYYDAESVREVANYDGRQDTRLKGSPKYKVACVPGQAEHTMASQGHERWPNTNGGIHMRNKRSVWSINTQPFTSAHFAVYPEKLIEPCILAGSNKGDIILDPFSGAGTTPVMAEKHKRQWRAIELNEDYCEIQKKRIKKETRQLTIT